MKGFAEKMMRGGSETLDQVADRIFAAAERGDFLILPTRKEPMRWRIKRWFPNWYFSRLMRSIAAMRNKP
jgi:hypothetical protein